MADVTEVLPEFPAFGVRYDPTVNPFFKAIMVENLRLVGSVAAGQTLFGYIKDAKPTSRGDYPIGINVMCVPKAVKYVESGFKPAAGGTIAASDDKRHIAPNGCNHYLIGSSANAAVNPVDSDNGKGTVCKMMFTNAQMITSRGESARPYVVLAHELIHSYHSLYGIKKPKDEELWTTGIGIYSDDPLTENVFRAQFKLAPRTEYY